MSVHHIHLRHPWLCEPQAEAVVWRRRFNRPTGLGSGQRVFVVMERLPGLGAVTLNGTVLGLLSGEAAPQRFEVTDQLQSHNELVLRLDWSAGADQADSSTPPGEVRLEIHSA